MALVASSRQPAPRTAEPLAPLAPTATWRRWIGPLAVVMSVVVVNLPALTGLVTVDPLGSIGATALHMRHGFIAGQWSLDPNIGFTSEALGHLSALDWLHGIVPWWNPFEGLGSPLAAEMQSAALFPPTLLLALPNGQLFFHMTLEAAAGVSTYFLVRELRLGRGLATMGGVLFALDGTLAWLGNAAANPVAFLPLMLLGVERLFRRRSDSTGWLLLAGGIALSVYAGFPEMAYIECLFTALWAVFRLAGSPAPLRRMFAARVVLGGVVGLMLAAPLLLAFAGYLPFADVGGHGGSGLRFEHLASWSTPILGLPYLYGPPVTFARADLTTKVSNYMGTGAGFVTASTLATAVVGLVAGRRERALRVLLGASAAVLLAWAFGFWPVQAVLARVVPLTAKVNVAKFSPLLWELAFVLLACFGVDAIARSRTAITRLAFLGGGLVALGTAAIALSFAWPTVAALYRTTRSYRIYPELMVCWAVAIVVVVVVLGILFSGRRAVALVVATLLVLDSSVMFTVPMLAAPREVTIDTAPVRYLARHLGYGRFFSLGILQPNYGSYFGLASADVNDLPVPRPWANYVTSSLDPNTIATIFNGSRAADPTGPSPSHELLERLSSYEQIGVRFVMVRTGARLFGRTHHLADGVREVFRDSFATIYALPHPEPYFETRGQRCAIVPSSRDLVVTRCAQGSLLIRSEIDLPGWSVTVNGRQARLRSVRQGVTAVEVPKGTSTVSFTYEPAHLNLGLGLFGAGVLLALGLPLRARRRRHKGNEKGGEPESPDQSGAGTAGEPALTPTR